jgi:hypothetical protein
MDSTAQLETLFLVAISHGSALEEERLGRYYFDRLFMECELVDRHFADTGVSSLLLECLWDRHREASTNAMTLDGFADTISNIAERYASHVRPSCGGVDEALLMIFEAVFTPYIDKCIVTHSTTASMEAAANSWSRLSYDVTAFAVVQALPALQIAFDAHATSGFLPFVGFAEVLQRYGVARFVASHLMTTICEEANKEDTKGLETGLVLNELEMDEFVDALLITAFAVHGTDDTHVTTQSKIYLFLSNFVKAVDASHNTTTAFASYDGQKAAHLLHPLASVVVPPQLTLSSGESVFVAGVNYMLDEPPPVRETSWDDVLGTPRRSARRVSVPGTQRSDVMRLAQQLMTTTFDPPRELKGPRPPLPLTVWFGDHAVPAQRVRRNRVKAHAPARCALPSNDTVVLSVVDADEQLAIECRHVQIVRVAVSRMPDRDDIRGAATPLLVMRGDPRKKRLTSDDAKAFRTVFLEHSSGDGVQQLMRRNDFDAAVVVLSRDGEPRPTKLPRFAEAGGKAVAATAWGDLFDMFAFSAGAPNAACATENLITRVEVDTSRLAVVQHCGTVSTLDAVLCWTGFALAVIYGVSGAHGDCDPSDMSAELARYYVHLLFSKSSDRETVQQHVERLESRSTGQVIEHAVPMYVEAAFDHTMSLHMPSLKLRTRPGETLPSASNVPVISPGYVTPRRPASRSTRTAVRQRNEPVLPVLFGQGTTAMMEPVSMVSPRRRQEPSGSPPRALHGIATPQRVELGAKSMLSPSPLDAQQLSEKVTRITAQLRGEYFHRSMHDVQNEPQNSLRPR